MKTKELTQKEIESLKNLKKLLKDIRSIQTKLLTYGQKTNQK